MSLNFCNEIVSNGDVNISVNITGRGEPLLLIHATCEDYRAGAGIDLEHDRADSGKKIQCPLLVVWGTLGPMGKLYDILATWQDKAENVQGLGLECGHYPAQEKPKELLAALEEFL